MKNQKSKSAILSALVFGFLSALVFGCSTVKYVPVETVKEVHIRDSIYLRDTLIEYRIEKEYIEKYADDTLRLETAYSNFVAFQDTTAGKLSGKAWNKDKTVEVPAQMKEKIVYRDTTITKEVPVPVEVEKIVKKVPWIYRVLSGIGIVALGLFAGWMIGKYLHLK